MNPDERQEIEAELIEVVEDNQVHHPRRDGDWMEPKALRKILRLMYWLIVPEEGTMDDTATK